MFPQKMYLGERKKNNKNFGDIALHIPLHASSQPPYVMAVNLWMLLCATFKAQRPPSQVSSMSIFNTHSKDRHVVEPHLVHR